MNKKAHLSFEGFHKILSMKASLNLGLSEGLKSEFVNINPVQRPLIYNKYIPDPY
jgi:hypothetical protein